MVDPWSPKRAHAQTNTTNLLFSSHFQQKHAWLWRIGSLEIEPASLQSTTYQKTIPKPYHFGRFLAFVVVDPWIRILIIFSTKHVKTRCYFWNFLEFYRKWRIFLSFSEKSRKTQKNTYISPKFQKNPKITPCFYIKMFNLDDPGHEIVKKL